MKKTRNTRNSKITKITAENVYSIVKNQVFNKYRIRIANRSGNIKIELKPGNRHLGGFRRPIEYTIGYTSGIGYWLRRQNEQGYTFPLHYNRNTGHYGFETFTEASSWLERLFIEKY